MFRVVVMTVLLTAFCAAGVEEPDRWEKDIRAFEEADRVSPPAPDGILFTGSSTARMWDLKRDFPDLPAVNRGFGGSSFADLVRHADRILAAHQPRVVVVYSGDNDIAGGAPPEEVFRNFEQFAEKTHTLRPKARLVVFSIKASTARWAQFPAMEEVNGKIRDWAEERDWAVFVDTKPVMLGENGQPRADLYLSDGLHMNPEGYRRWAELLRPHLD